MMATSCVKQYVTLSTTQRKIFDVVERYTTLWIWKYEFGGQFNTVCLA